MVAKSRPTLRQFIYSAAKYGVEEKALFEKLPSGREKFKIRYLQRNNLAVVIPHIRESDRLTEAVFGYLLRGLGLEEFEQQLR